MPVPDGSLLTTVDGSAVECHERHVEDEPRPDALDSFLIVSYSSSGFLNYRLNACSEKDVW